MKTFFVSSCAVALACLGSAVSAEPFPPVSPQFITIGENNLVPGGEPSEIALQTVPLARATAFFSTLRQEAIEARYIIGSCEDRAHYIAMMAQRAGLSVGKVWAIAPARYTLLSRELIRVSDPSGITEQVTWGHHVAPVLRVDRGQGDVRTVVIDLAFHGSGFLDLDEWTGRLGPRALFFFTGADMWLFNSLDALQVSDPRPANDRNRRSDDPASVTMPRWMPNILTGQFMRYDPQIHNKYISAGMAQDDIAMRVFTGLATYPETDRSGLRNLLQTEDGVKSLVADGPVTGVSAGTQRALQSYYRTRESHWAARLAALNR
ncbi:MAG TPA: protein-glutamine glutaminase family protein [Allosphingosinicella sp.]|jgi:hypothetical protein